MWDLNSFRIVNKRSFFVTETSPYLQGVRLTSWELNNAGFDVTVIAECMCAQVKHIHLEIDRKMMA